MKTVSNYFWRVVLALLVIHGASVVQNEWKRKSIHDHGEVIEITIDELNCPKGSMTFHLGPNLFEKKIDARTCVLFNEGQRIKLKHSRQYPEMFLFVNERNPNAFISGGLEIVLGIIGLLANWSLVINRKSKYRNFSALPNN